MDVQNQHKSYWHPWKGKVYDTVALYRYFKPGIEEEAQRNGAIRIKTWLLGKAEKHVILNLSLCGVKKTVRNEAMELFCVGPVVADSKEERWVQRKKDVEIVRLFFCPEYEDNPPNWEPTPSEEQIREVCDKELYVIEKGHQQLRNDLNEAKYPLPHGVDEDDLRTWMTKWTEFDLELDESGYAWTAPVEVEADKRDSHQVFVASLQPWIEDWESFDVDIDGEAGWDVIEPDLVKYDKTTPQQDAILESRACRTDLEDKGRMERRRAMLASYFMFQYNWEMDKLAPYLGWADTMEEAARDLDALSETVY